MKKSFIYILLLTVSIALFSYSPCVSDSLRLITPEERAKKERQMQKKVQEKEVYLTLSDSKKELSTKNALMPYLNSEEEKDHVEGVWMPERAFVDTDGSVLQTEFAFDSSGKGTSRVTDKEGKIFEADAKASIENGTFTITISKYTNPTSKTVYAGNTFECSNDNGFALCTSKDGRLKDLHFVALDTKTQVATEEKGKESREDGTKEIQEESISLPKGDEKPLAIGNSMLIPQNAKDKSFTEGTWSFDRDFVDSKGEPVRVEFRFDAQGKGSSTLTDAKNEEFHADAVAEFDKDRVTIQTSKYSNESKTKVFPNLFVECKNVGSHMVCKGTDGWKVFENEHLVAADTIASQNAKKSAKKSTEKNAQKGAATHQEKQEDEKNAQEENERKAELSDGGAELAPAILERAEKAQYKPKSKSPLAGGWRYSRDLARKSDGASVSLEFQFDADGHGSSQIRDSAAKEVANSPAEVFVLPNGVIRVKTDEYAINGRKAYYPTFMECRKGQKNELDCDVSNGWMRLEHGSLISLDSIKEQEKQAQFEELRPLESAAAKEEEQKEGEQKETSETKGEKKSVEDLLAQMSEQAQETREETKEEKEEPKPKQQNHLVIPKQAKTMSFLKGKWRCNTGLVRSKDWEPIVVEFSFNANGNGSALIRERSGAVFSASAKASYRNGKLRINTSDFYSDRSRGRYFGQFMECSQKGSYAVCAGHDRDGELYWHNATFTRIR